MASERDGNRGDTAPAVEPRPGRHPLLCVFVAWLVPGAGHFLLRRPMRAVAYFGIILTLFSLGIALDGRLDRPDREAPLSYFKTAADLGVGPLYFAFVLPARGARLGSPSPPLGVGDPRSSTYEHATTFLLTAGLLNLLLLIDVWDLATGRKG